MCVIWGFNLNEIRVSKSKLIQMSLVFVKRFECFSDTIQQQIKNCELNNLIFKLNEKIKANSFGFVFHS